jgi:hypothetical protein
MSTREQVKIYQYLRRTLEGDTHDGTKSQIKQVVAKTIRGFPLTIGEREMPYGNGFVIQDSNDTDIICVNEKFHDAGKNSIQTDIGTNKIKVDTGERNYFMNGLPRVWELFGKKYGCHINLAGYMVVASDDESSYYTVMSDEPKFNNAGLSVVYKVRVTIDGGARCCDSLFIFYEKFKSVEERAAKGANFVVDSINRHEDERKTLLSSLHDSIYVIRNGSRGNI